MLRKRNISETIGEKWQIEIQIIRLATKYSLWKLQ